MKLDPKAFGIAAASLVVGVVGWGVDAGLVFGLGASVYNRLQQA